MLFFLDRKSTSVESALELHEFDHKHPSCMSQRYAILYGTIGTKSFQELHMILKEQAEKGEVCYVLRHIVPSGTKTMHLAGYGAELAIKSLEYKAQDDSKIEKKDASEPEEEETSEEEEDTEEAVQGIFFDTLQKRYPQYASELANFKSSLLSSEMTFEDIKPEELKGLKKKIINIFFF